jgi:hypothetical protein
VTLQQDCHGPIGDHDVWLGQLYRWFVGCSKMNRWLSWRKIKTQPHHVRAVRVAQCGKIDVRCTGLGVESSWAHGITSCREASQYPVNSWVYKHNVWFIMSGPAGSITMIPGLMKSQPNPCTFLLYMAGLRFLPSRRQFMFIMPVIEEVPVFNPLSDPRRYRLCSANRKWISPIDI